MKPQIGYFKTNLAESMQSRDQTMRNLLQTFWLTIKCMCSESVAREVIFADDHAPRHSPSGRLRHSRPSSYRPLPN